MKLRECAPFMWLVVECSNQSEAARTDRLLKSTLNRIHAAAGSISVTSDELGS